MAFRLCIYGMIHPKSLVSSPSTRLSVRRIFTTTVNGKQLTNLDLVDKAAFTLTTTFTITTRVPFSFLRFTRRNPFSTMGESQKALLDKAKKLAAYQAVDDHIRDGQIVGIGSGTTAVYAVERIAQRVKEENLKLVCIPTSFQAKNLIVSNGLQLSELDVHYPIDVTIDGCDECDPELNIIKGGGGCLLQEKIVASASKKLIIVGDYTKESQYLGEKWKKGVPLEVSQMAARVVLEKLHQFSASVGVNNPTTVRQAVSKMGPVITDNGNFCMDFQIGEILKTQEIHTPQSLNAWLKTIPGILETGLFLRMANQAYFGQADGSVRQTKERVYKNGA